MKNILLTAIGLVCLTLLFSCKKDDTPSVSGKSVVNEVTGLTSDSFTLNGTFALECEEKDAVCYAGFFLGDREGVCAEQYGYCVGQEEMEGVVKNINCEFVNVDDENSRIFPVGSTVYYRPFISVSVPGKETSYLYGEETSFEVPKAKYTIMVYGVGGGNLDYSNTAVLMVPMMKAGCDGNVEITFQYKMSSAYQTTEYKQIGEESLALNGTHRWAAPYKGRFLEKWDSSCDALEGADYIKKAYNTFGEYSDSIGDIGYKMNDPAHLAEFIDWSTEKCPAEHYILLLKDHGTGWDIFLDSRYHGEETKAGLSDDNLGPVPKFKYMSLVDLMEGIKSSSVEKFTCVIFDQCLMATVENLAEISQVSDYAVAAQEVTISLKGEEVVDVFRNAVSSETGIYNGLCRLVDDYAGFYSDFYTDQGAYDFKYIDSYLTASANVSEFFRRMYSASPDWKVAISGGVTSAIRSHMESDESIRKRISAVKAKLDDWYNLNEDEKEEVVREIDYINNSTYYSFCLYDFISQTVKSAEEYKDMASTATFGSEISTLKGLLSEYDGTLRKMAHLACTRPLSADTPYEWTSPAVCLQSLKDGVYEWTRGEWNLYCYFNCAAISREDAIKVYQATYFDQCTSWSELLKMLDVSGTLFFNDDRKFRQEGK